MYDIRVIRWNKKYIGQLGGIIKIYVQNLLFLPKKQEGGSL